MSKREALQNMIGQAKLMEIINKAYELAATCPNCKELSEWWEKYGSAVPPTTVVKSGPTG